MGMNISIEELDRWEREGILSRNLSGNPAKWVESKEPAEGPSRKYHNEPTVASDGTKCASKKEAKRWELLLLREKAREITYLTSHPSWELIVNGVKIGKYTADASYRENGELVVEDVKSKITKTTAYRLRKRLMLALHGIDVKEV